MRRAWWANREARTFVCVAAARSKAWVGLGLLVSCDCLCVWRGLVGSFGLGQWAGQVVGCQRRGFLVWYFSFYRFTRCFYWKNRIPEVSFLPYHTEYQKPIKPNWPVRFGKTVHNPKRKSLFLQDHVKHLQEPFKNQQSPNFCSRWPLRILNPIFIVPFSSITVGYINMEKKCAHVKWEKIINLGLVEGWDKL